MSELVLIALYFLRPIAYGLSQIAVFGLNFLEFFAVISFVFLILLALANAGRFKLTITDAFIVAFVLWCGGAFFVYLEKAQVADLAKFLIPFLSYLILRNSIHSREQFLRLLWVMIVAASCITIVTAALIASHKGIYKQDFWTGIYRFTGVYPNPHDFGHSMTFMLMLLVIYVTLWSTTMDRKIPVWRVLLISVTAILGLYCLYKSYVRTAYIGLLIFGMIYLFLLNKKLFVLAAAGVSVLVVGLWSVWSLIFYDVVHVYQGKRDADRIASGRPFIWKHNLEIFEKLTFDRKIAGVGIGNRSHVLGARNSIRNDNVWNSHNDFLDVMMQTGIVGLIIFMIIQLLLLRWITRLRGRDRCAFLAFFIAVAAMNFASNSYVTRFALGQSFYMVIIFAEAVALGYWSPMSSATPQPETERRRQPWRIHYGRPAANQVKTHRAT